MKKLIPFLIAISMLYSCSPAGYHIGTGDKKNNLTHWKADRMAKKAAKAERIEKAKAARGKD